MSSVLDTCFFNITFGDTFRFQNRSFAYPPFNDYNITYESDKIVRQENFVVSVPPAGNDGGASEYIEVYSFTERGSYKFRIQELDSSLVRIYVVNVF